MNYENLCETAEENARFPENDLKKLQFRLLLPVLAV